MLDALEKRQGKTEGVTVVVDRGMADKDNLELINSRGYHYVVAARQSERDRWLGEFEEEEGFIEVSRYPRVARYYEITYHKDKAELVWAPKEEKKEEAEKLDGSYLLKTDRTDLSSEEAWHIYSLLTRAENAFRTMKSPLAERPIFHQLKHRVRVFLCVLAYHLLVAIEKTLHDQGLHTSWGTVRDMLKTHQVVTMVLPGADRRVLKIRCATRPSPEQLELYTKLNVPSEPIRPKKTWLKQG